MHCKNVSNCCRHGSEGRTDGRTDGRMAVPRFSLASDGWYRPGRLLLVFVPETNMNFSEFSIGTRTEQDMILLVFMELDE